MGCWHSWLTISDQTIEKHVGRNYTIGWLVEMVETADGEHHGRKQINYVVQMCEKCGDRSERCWKKDLNKFKGWKSTSKYMVVDGRLVRLTRS
jgi:hypothetical protein